jgi:hypothetical protein
MKLDILLAQYLYQRHKLQLQTVGTFLLNEEEYSNSFVPGEPIPDTSITFVQDEKTELDDELISYIASSTGKMRALAEADLDSLIHDGKELINLHQQFTIEGIGCIGQTLKGKLIFKAGKYVQSEYSPLNKHDKHGKPSARKSSLVNTILQDAPVIDPSSDGGLVRRWWIFAAIIILAGSAGLLASINKTSQEKRPGGKDQSSLSYFKNMISQPIADQASSLSVNDENGTGKSNFSSGHIIAYNVVFEVADSNRAFTRYHQLTSWGDNVVLYKKNSSKYALAAPFTTVPEDTVNTKDSIKVLFGRKVYIDKLTGR